jgi:hypothetical protein
MASKLKPEVARKYEFGTHHAVVVMGTRTLNLCDLTLAEADALVARGDFPYLKRKAKKPRVKK